LLKKALPFILLAGSIVLIVVLSFLPFDFSAKLTAENSFIEHCAAFFYGVAALFSFWQLFSSSKNRLFWAQFSFVLLFFFLREMDFHLLFTDGQSTMRDSFYFKKDFPLWQRFLFAVYYLALFAIIFRLAVRYYSFLITAIRKGHLWAINASVFLFAMLTAFLMERAFKDVATFFISKARAASLEGIIEEVLELLAGILLVIVVGQIKKPLEDWRS